MTTNDDWAQELVQRVGAAARELRGKRSAKWLADRTAELGYPISAQVIAKLDSGHRGTHLQVAELLILARALNTAPAMLLFPGIPGEKVELFPGVQIESRLALEWLAGDKALLQKFAWRKGSEDSEDARDVFQRGEWLAEWQQNTRPIRLAKEHQRLLTEHSRQQAERERWLQDRDNADAQEFAAATGRSIDSTEQSIRTIRRQIRELGLTPPALPARVAAHFDKDPEDA
ncbi:hypothetical protein [Rhodococcus sp. 2G]|uniref:hypothetical protein n=1 Tax=Rhodococcus sp. 2G TaxID=1570939 RepID=UPI000A4CCC82|nr:hypothetical protein [Rhodococcus sp. 2G]